MSDYIKREAIQKALIDLPADLDAKTVQRCIESVHNFPAADVRENVHGRWRCEGMGDFYCTICGWEGSGADRYRFCPNCGAQNGGERMTDYIKRDSVLNDIGELFTLCYETLPNECGHHYIVENELKIHWDYIKELPAEDVRENKHGKWIDTGSGEECSVCHEIQYGYDSGRRFCANCGAQMGGGDEP